MHNTCIDKFIAELSAKYKTYSPKLYKYTFVKEKAYNVLLAADELISNAQQKEFRLLLDSVYTEFPKTYEYTFSFFYSKQLVNFFEIYSSDFFIKKLKLIVSSELKNPHELVHGFASCINPNANKILEEGLAIYIECKILGRLSVIANKYSYSDILKLKKCQTDSEYILCGFLVFALMQDNLNFFKLYEFSTPHNRRFLRYLWYKDTALI